MFGYKDNSSIKQRFIFSPLGNLFLKNKDDSVKRSKIFLSMLWAIQFMHPHSGTRDSINLHPFRLVYKLLLDKRLEGKLFSKEVSYILVFVETINDEKYEELVADILAFRQLTNSEVVAKFTEDRHVYVNSLYEWDYYTTTVLENEGVLDISIGEQIGRLKHGNTETYRKITTNYVTIPDDLKPFVEKMMDEYKYNAPVINLADENRLKIDAIKELYSFYPETLLRDIGEYDEEIQNILDLPKLIDQYSNNNEGEEAYLFEDILEEGFNNFFNVEAKKIGGAGNTDLECLYLTEDKKFAVDAKSTKNKLSNINAGRLNRHREKIGGKYTIVVTSRYVPAIKHDIAGSVIVVLLASTFSEYLYHNIVNNIRKIDYKDIDEIIESNLGKDVSNLVSDLTISRFGVSSDLS